MWCKRAVLGVVWMWGALSGCDGASATTQPSGGALAPKAAVVERSALDPRYVEAASALEAGQPDRAMALCEPLVVQVPDCLRVVGVVRKQRGEAAAACEAFGAYLKSPAPRDRPSVERARELLACP